ncbi:IclR family transcriptional regulator domain-containing protein [Lentzea nigeriaca]|uniref:IclR family transcriptional regulator domain-containing protein n=1 Tax=Lentzea nigeriaca TaxID=1128665 RepID=UPI00195CD3A5|nr:IclR family transcriptional regulator C-terminal domain-containing protein [Lentzea nigeriaca]MBM7856390.1 IclR family pca regulon transcriptional regulator [Lentzea nigeriaca]
MRTSERPTGEDRGPHFVQSVARALSVMRSFSADRPSQSLADVARATGLDRATARRLLLTLADLGYVRAEARDFQLTPRVLELGYAYLSGLSLPEIALPHLRKLAGDLNETAALAVLDGDEIVYVALIPSSRVATVRINIGTRFEAYPTSMGRVLLAGLPEQQLEDYLARLRLESKTDRTVRSVDALRQEIDRTREQGWALVEAELEAGLRGAAAPVRDRAGAVIAAANVSVHAGRMTPQEVEREYVPAILRTVRMIEADMMGLA